MYEATYNRNHQTILEEAGRCLLEEGFTKTTVKKVADRLGLSRQTVYRIFGSRDDMLSALYMHQFYQDVFEKIKVATEELDFEEGFKISTILTVRAIRKNAIMIELMHGSGALWFQRNMYEHGTDLHRRLIQSAVELWGEKLQQSRKAGHISSAVSDEMLYEWLYSVHYMMIFRRNATEADHLTMLEYLVMPSLVSGKR